MRPHHDDGESPDSGGEAQFSASYDERDGQTQARTRKGWDADIEAAIADLDLSAEFRAAGRTWAEADEKGQVFRRR
ncbi:hypothetical protein AB0N29_19950 [Nocardioides sp. NPDC092400]|uniref:hypothetical protein n=1 Tax=Nocardioides sp. NPDC092400 TaxID=3155196 RepID=UPI003416BF8C